MTTLLKFIPELRNTIINGNLDFWQRGSSFNIGGNNDVYTADRIRASTGGSLYTLTVARSTDVPTQAQSGAQSQYSMLVTNGTGAAPTAGAYTSIVYNMEGQDYAQIHGKRCRLQFWCKSSVTGTFAVGFRNGGFHSRTYVSTYTVNSANIWEKKSIDLTMDTGSPSGAWNIDNTNGLEMWFTVTTGTTFQTASLNTWQNGNAIGASGQTQWAATTGATFQISQIGFYPITAGTGIDLPFVRAGKTIGHELQLCQRYYEKSYSQSVVAGTATNAGRRGVALGTAATSVIMCYSMPFATDKRATPTATIYSLDGTSGSVTSYTSSLAANANRIIGGTNIGDSAVEVFFTTGGGDTGFGFHFTADAEL